MACCLQQERPSALTAWHTASCSYQHYSTPIKFRRRQSNFTVPKPRPLTITESTDLLGFATATAGLALRLFTGAFVLGWKVDTLFAPELNAEGRKQYSLKLGPLRIRDSSSVLDMATTQPAETVVLYDNESLPRCRRVREMMNLLDITYECRPGFCADIADQLP